MCRGYCDGDSCVVKDCSRSGNYGTCDYYDGHSNTCEKVNKHHEDIDCTRFREDCPLDKKANDNILWWRKKMNIPE